MPLLRPDGQPTEPPASEAVDITDVPWMATVSVQPVETGAGQTLMVLAFDLVDRAEGDASEARVLTSVDGLAILLAEITMMAERVGPAFSEALDSAVLAFLAAQRAEQAGRLTVVEGGAGS